MRERKNIHSKKNLVFLEAWKDLESKILKQFLIHDDQPSECEYKASFKRQFFCYHDKLAVLLI